ncbi:MAG: hypothetical protein J7539_09065 [Niabella sp.]|nr:hypothetical protein [Niabella sp.]
MKNHLLVSKCTCVFLALFLFHSADAQFSGVLGKAKDKLEQKARTAVDKGLQGTSSATESSTTGNATGKKRISMTGGFDFKAGDSVLFKSNFEKLAAGAMPGNWKTNGSGQLVKSGDIAGTWLELHNGATYKLNQNYKLPQRFTIEFDLLTSCDKIRDISPVAFGFADNNSVAGFNEGDIAHTQLEFYNKDQISSFAGPVNKSYYTNFDLSPFANAPLHISISVDGEQMKVYLDKTKVLDSKMFRENASRYFFISAPISAENDAKVYFSNVVIAK